MSKLRFSTSFLKLALCLIAVLLIMCIVPNKSKATEDDGTASGTVTIYWTDCHDKQSVRPDSIDVSFYDEQDKDTLYTVTISKDDPNVTVKENYYKGSYSEAFDAWIIDVTFDLKPTSKFSEFRTVAFMLDEITNIENYMDDYHNSVYFYNDGNYTSDNDISVDIILYWNLYPDFTVTVNFYDDNERDFSRYVPFYLKPTNYDGTTYYYEIGDSTQNTFDSRYVISNLASGLDTYIFSSEYLMTTSGSSGVLRYMDDESLSSYGDKIEYEVAVEEEKTGYSNYGYSYEASIDDDGNVIIDVIYNANKISVPVTVVWEDDDDYYGVRPDTLTLHAVNQKGTVEDVFEISSDTDWEKVVSLFEHVAYSYGKTDANYTLTVAKSDDYYYTFTVSGDNNGLVLTATYTEPEVDEENNDLEDNDEEIDNEYDEIEIEDGELEEEIENPSTSDNALFIVTTLFTIGLLGSIVTITMIRKTKKIENK